MKKSKITLWAVILLFVGLFFYQNKDFFMAGQSLNYGFPFFELHHAPELPVAILFLLSLLTGLLIAYFFSLSERFKSKKIIKNFNAATISQMEEISALKKELEALRSGSSSNSQDSKEENEKSEN
jgi:uncharacterized integral membrane protein